MKFQAAICFALYNRAHPNVKNERFKSRGKISNNFFYVGLYDAVQYFSMQASYSPPMGQGFFFIFCYEAFSQRPFFEIV